MFLRTADHLQVYVEERGNSASLETVVFLNGLTQSTMAWHFMVPFFKQRYRVILLDFVFQGQSDKEGEWRDFDQHARDVHEVITQLQVKEPIVVGISYGSLVAQH